MSPESSVPKKILDITRDASWNVLKFVVIVEKDEDGVYVASVPELQGCHSQAKTLDELARRVKEAIETYLEVEGAKAREGLELVGFQFVEACAD